MIFCCSKQLNRTFLLSSLTRPWCIFSARVNMFRDSSGVRSADGKLLQVHIDNSFINFNRQTFILITIIETRWNCFA